MMSSEVLMKKLALSASIIMIFFSGFTHFQSSFSQTTDDLNITSQGNNIQVLSPSTTPVKTIVVPLR